MLTRIEWSGGIQYKDDQGRLHRTDGPAVISKTGVEHWYYFGKIHRTQGPAIIYSDGDEMWAFNGKWMPCPK